MINFNLRAFIDALADLNVAQSRARFAIPDDFPSEELLREIKSDLAPIDRAVSELEMPTAHSRIAKIAVFAGGALAPNRQLAHEINELFDAVERDASNQFFCHYDNERIKFLKEMPDDWEPVYSAFPSAKPEIEAGVDCYALGHNTACVFHMVRVGEIGLRMIARERGVKDARKNVPLDWGTWGQVFAAIEKQLKSIRKRFRARIHRGYD